MEDFEPQALMMLWQIERTGSFSAAARELGWSQPAISQHVKRAESQCKVQLVVREAHGVRLTEAGTMLARHGRLIADRLTQASREIQDYRERAHTHVQLLAPPSICSTIVARSMVNLSWSTDMDVSISQAEPPEALERVAGGTADLAVIFRHASQPDFPPIDDELESITLFDDPMLLLVKASSDYAKAYERTGEPIDLIQARNERWIAGCDTCRLNLLALAEQAGFTPDIRHATDDYWVTQNLVEMGMGLSLVPRLAAQIPLRDDLRACPVSAPNAYRTISVVTRRHDTRTAITQVRNALEQAAARFRNASSAL